jgi:hypothetical protein
VWKVRPAALSTQFDEFIEKEAYASISAVSLRGLFTSFETGRAFISSVG